MNREQKAALWLAMHEYIGAVRANRLRELAGSYEDIRKLPIDIIREEEILKPKELALWEACTITDSMTDRMEERLDKLGIRLVIPEDPDYPKRLKSLRDSPAWLFARGSLPSDEIPSAAIVGARSCTDYGREQAEFIGRLLARYGIQVISGLAEGVDAAAHQGVLSERGFAFAVLGNGLNVCYPQSSRNLFMEIPGRGGLISEHLPDVRPLHWHFPARNRIISGLSDLVIVIEAKKRSGSLITADLALEQGRDVFALPGRWNDPLSEGCNRLIRVGAGIVTNPTDILDYFHMKLQSGVRDESSGAHLAKKEKMVYSAIDSYPRHADDIMERAGLPSAECMEILAGLEIRGLIRQSENQYYVRK